MEKYFQKIKKVKDSTTHMMEVEDTNCNKKVSPRYHKLITAFYKIWCSNFIKYFNENEPIVNKPWKL